MTYPAARPTACCPRATTCCFCISLRLGVYLIALFDTAFSFLKVIGCILLLSQPQILVGTRDNPPGVPGGSEGVSEYDLGSLRANLIIAIGTVYFGFKGALATRTCDPEGLRPYLNWKVFQVVMVMIISAMVHRVWWAGCGLLSPSACASLKAQLVLGSLLAAVPGLYFVWKIWSLWSYLEEGDEFELYNAGYNDDDLEHLRARAAARRYPDGDTPYHPFASSHSPAQPVQPNTTYLV